MKKYVIPVILVILTVFLLTGCDLIFGLFGGGDDGGDGDANHHYAYGMVEHDNMIYYSNFADEKVTTVADGADVNPADFPVSYLPHGLACDGTDTWVCDLNAHEIVRYADDSGTESKRVEVGSEPVNLIFLPQRSVERSRITEPEPEPVYDNYPKRILVADRMDNCLYAIPYDNLDIGKENYGYIDLSEHMGAEAIAYTDMYYNEADGLVYIVSDEFFGFITVDMFINDPQTSVDFHAFTGVTEGPSDFGCMGIVAEGSTIYVNTGGRIIRSDYLGNSAVELCDLFENNPVTTAGYYIDLVISDSSIEDLPGFSTRILTPPENYLYVISGLFWEDTIAPHIVKVSMDGTTVSDYLITEF